MMQQLRALRAARSSRSRGLSLFSSKAIPATFDIESLQAIEKKSIWLSSYMIHNANNVREKRDGLKV